MKAGDVILTPLPQADGKIKTRPAIFLREMPPFQDILVCGVTTQLHQMAPDFDEIIAQRDSDFSASGLIAESLIWNRELTRSKPASRFAAPQDLGGFHHPSCYA